MPKLTVTGKELGSSEGGPIVMGRDDFNTRDDILKRHKLAAQGVETIEQAQRNKQALMRGTHLEHGIADWFLEAISEELPGSTLTEPAEAYRDEEARMGASIDRILTLPEGSELVVDYNGDQYTFNGVGIVEIKTDFYHTDKPKSSWIIQVHHQMMCANLSWALVVVMNQKGQLKIYPFHREDLLCQTIRDKYAEFWHLVDTDGEYPPLEEDAGPGLREATIDDDAKQNVDLQQLCADYQAASAEARKWSKAKDEAKQALALALDSLEVEIVNVGSYQIKSIYTQVPKRQMMDVPGEFTERHAFSVKEKSDE
jgi:hypothetical protein